MVLVVGVLSVVDTFMVADTIMAVGDIMVVDGDWVYGGSDIRTMTIRIILIMMFRRQPCM